MALLGGKVSAGDLMANGAAKASVDAPVDAPRTSASWAPGCTPWSPLVG
jgi:hypothetical protein